MEDVSRSLVINLSVQPNWDTGHTHVVQSFPGDVLTYILG